MWLQTSIYNLNLIDALRTAIAQVFFIDLAQNIPLSISFRRPGLEFRSAILLQKHASVPLLYQELLAQIYPYFSESTPPTPNAFQFEVICTEKKWLEFRLAPDSLKCWLQLCQHHLEAQVPKAIALFERDSEQAFRWQYLLQRCQSLTNLAVTLDPTRQPQWCFTEYDIPPWEQALLDGVARYLLAQLSQDPRGDRHLSSIETAFWEFHRHCALFSFYPSQPERFWHYVAWLNLLLAIAPQP